MGCPRSSGRVGQHIGDLAGSTASGQAHIKVWVPCVDDIQVPSQWASFVECTADDHTHFLIQC